MEHVIEFGRDAELHLDEFSARDRKTILAAIEKQLVHELDVQTRNRKRLRENPLGQWELRVGRFRVFYNLEEEQTAVLVVAVGIKEGNRLTIQGKQYRL